MSAVETVRAALLGLLEGVPAIGRVHGYERYAASLDQLRALYVATIDGAQQLRGWYLRRTGQRERRIAHGCNAAEIDWEIRGFMALADAAVSELVFDGLLDAIAGALRADDTLAGAVFSIYSADGDGPQIVDSGPVMFAGVLCHSAKLRVTTSVML